LPKKEGSEEVNDYWPISLIHSIQKLLTRWLLPGLPHLCVALCQMPKAPS
jgi:hypothetical protein